MERAVFEVRRVYGNLTAYPASRLAEAAMDLANRRTADPRHIAILMDMGIAIELDGAASERGKFAGHVNSVLAGMGRPEYIDDTTGRAAPIAEGSPS